MAFSFKTLTNRFKKTNSVATIRMFKTPVHPDRDWKIIFIVFSIVSLIIATANLLLFIRVERGEVYEIALGGSVESVTIDRNQLEEVIRKYTERQNQLEILKQQPVITADPFR